VHRNTASRNRVELNINQRNSLVLAMVTLEVYL